ncbi:MAG: MarP family serine protease [Candidatus Dormibacteraeota bacterium]|nr:MarP family serine protease [Candidatus Dormibacteraeota bacterium]MBV9525793.1 MarP family serine protease [Candidatus Dormibacteraeota bacterium]
MDVLDLVIIALLLVFAISGFRRGLSWVGPSMIGLLVGLLVGALAAPPIARALTHSRTAQPLIAIGFFLAIALIIQGVGTGIGFQARVRALRTSLATADSVAGAALSLVGVLAAAWYLGLTFSQSPWTELDNQIAGSRIIRAVDSFFPRPPGFLASIQNVLRGAGFPNPFADIVPSQLAPVQIPPLVNTPGIRQATSVTSKVIASGCGGGAEAGSSWPVAPDYVVTNAHVVAGSSQVVVITPSDQATHAATVVLYDPNIDVAVLHVPGLGLSPLSTMSADPPSGTSGAVIGYPGGGDERVVAAAVRGTESAQGYNVYGDTLVTRDIAVLAANVVPGNSGGPIVNNNGAVIGLVFAASTTDPNTGYALTVSQISGDIHAGVGHTQPVSTQACTS